MDTFIIFQTEQFPEGNQLFLSRQILFQGVKVRSCGNGWLKLINRILRKRMRDHGDRGTPRITPYTYYHNVMYSMLTLKMVTLKN